MQALNASLISACAALLYWTSWDTYHIYPNIRQQSYTIPHLKYRGLEYVSHIIIVYKVKQVLHKYFPEKGAVKGDIYILANMVFLHAGLSTKETNMGRNGLHLTY